jgi:hypothetical protein
VAGAAIGLGARGDAGTSVVTSAQPDQTSEPTTTTTTVASAPAGHAEAVPPPGGGRTEPTTPASSSGATGPVEQSARPDPAGEAPAATTTTTTAPSAELRPGDGRPVDPDGVEVPPVDPLAELSDDAAAAFGDRFAGVAEVDGQPTVFVKETDAELPADFQGAPVRGVRYSFAELRAFRAHVTASMDELGTRGVSVAYVGDDTARNQISVGLRQLDPTLEAAFFAVVGEGPYHLELAQWVAGGSAS